MKFRNLTDLSYEEINELLNYVFENNINSVSIINRDKKNQTVSCTFNFNGETCDNGEPFMDTIDINMYCQNIHTDALEAHDYEITGEEILRAEKYLLAKGCHYLLKENPWIENNVDKEKFSSLILKAKGPKRTIRAFAEEIGVAPSTLTRIINKQNKGKSSYALLEKIAKHAYPQANVTLEKLLDVNGCL